MIAAILFCLCVLVAAGFQLGLASGRPWGEWAMAGRFPGQWPYRFRILALVQAMLLIGFAILVASSVPLFDWISLSLQVWGQASLPWIFGFSVLSAFLNTVTPSQKERRLWAPVTWVMAITVAALWFEI